MLPKSNMLVTGLGRGASAGRAQSPPELEWRVAYRIRNRGLSTGLGKALQAQRIL